MALTDREIWELGYKYVPNQEYLLNPFRTPTTTDDDDETTPGSGTGSGTGINMGHEEEFEGGVPPGVLGSEALLSQFNLATEDRQKRLENPNKITSFFNNLTGGGQRTVDQMKRDATAYYMSKNAPPYQIDEGDIVLIPDGDFHKVFNIGKYELGGESIATNLNDLEFICVFDGGRNH